MAQSDNLVIVMQARTSSSRLPGKVLLPVGGLPLVVLAARRAASTGRGVVVAITDEPSDDELAATLKSHGVAHVRGPLDDVLGRFVQATSNFASGTAVCRMTADNCVPDGALIDACQRVFRDEQLDYLSTTGTDAGLPYGCSLEMFAIDALRDADRAAKTAHEREHVTPYIRAHAARSQTAFPEFQGRKLANYRCTIDNIDDYVFMCGVFHDLADPVGQPWDEVVSAIVARSAEVVSDAPASRFVLGTAQLGLDYGINNKLGRPALAEAGEILRTAVRNGVGWLDTARSYGASEEALGRFLERGWRSEVKVCTKVSPLADLPETASEAAIQFAVMRSVMRSLENLRMHRVDTLLLHRAAHLTAWNGAAYECLKRLKADGVAGQIGVSVQNPEELRAALALDDVGHIQLPFNVMDWRWSDVIGAIEQAKASRSLTIHVRSVFLQGLLFNRERSAWLAAGEQQPEEIWHWLDGLPAMTGCETLHQACIDYVAAFDWIDGIVIGVDAKEHLLENLRAMHAAGASAIDVAAIDAGRLRLQAATLDPAQWTN